jgi:nucleoside-diphosphate-sugar epimerase
LDAWETVIVNQNKCRNNLFTIGPANALQITEHAKNIAELLNWQGTINWNTKSKRHGEIYLLNSNNKKLSQLTGWYPKVSYNDGLQATIDFWNRM